jgi:hypothetical protein
MFYNNTNKVVFFPPPHPQNLTFPIPPNFQTEPKKMKGVWFLSCGLRKYITYIVFNNANLFLDGIPTFGFWLKNNTNVNFI